CSTCGGGRTWTWLYSSGGFGRLGRFGLGLIATGRRGRFVVAAATLGALGLVALLVLVLHDQRLLGLGLVAADDQVAQDRVVEAEGLDQLVEHVLAGLDVEQHVVGLDQVLDRIGQLAAAPVLETVDLAVAVLDQRLVTLDHRRHLLALVRMDQEHDFVMAHGGSFRVFGRPRGRFRNSPPSPGTDAVEQGLPGGQAAGSRALWRIHGLRARRAPAREPAGHGTGRASRLPARRAPGTGLRPQAALSASVVKLSPQPQAAAALGLSNTNSWLKPRRTKSMVVPFTIARLAGSTRMRRPSYSLTESPSRASRASSTT